MDTNRFVTLLIGLLVASLMVGAMALPIISATVDNSVTVEKTNDYGVFANAMDEDLTVSIGINSEDNTKWDYTVNGVTINYPIDGSVAYPVLLTDQFQVLLSDGIIIAYSSNARFTGQTEFTATLSNDVLTGSSTNGTTPHTYNSIPYSWAFYSAESGDYRTVYLLNNETETVYFTDINDVYGSNFVFTTNKYYSFHGETVTYYSTAGTPTTINATVESDKVTSTVDMKVFDVSRNDGGYSFVVDNDGTDYTVHPWVFIVPYKVTSDTSQYSPIIGMLLELLPLIAGVGVLGIAVAYFITRY